MLTVGIDLAAEPKNTALAKIEWTTDSARVLDLQVDVNDDAIVESAADADKIGIDCPLGWPDTFVRFLRDFHEGSHAGIPAVADSAWRRSLAYRITDEQVRTDLAEFKVIPLSVATDRIGLTAMHAARLQALLAAVGHKVDRDGTGLIVEVYPAGGLAYWGMKHRQYKGSKYEVALGDLVGSLPRWLKLGEHEALCRRSDHAFDAVVAALLARAAALGFTKAPSADQLAAAIREGWIAMPNRAIDNLINRTTWLKFQDDDAGYVAWQAANPGLYVINAERSLNPYNLVLHRATCRTISGVPTRGGPWTGAYVKICGSRTALDYFAQGNARACGTCHPDSSLDG
jgi:predicted nuclease with RNAse H fold